MADDDRNLEGFLGRRMARQSRLLRHRYKEGFDRLAIALFGLFALAFALMWLIVNETYSLPPQGTTDAALIDDKLAASCDAELESVLVMLCRERVLATYRWAHYADALGLGGRDWLFAVVLAVAGSVGAWPLVRWIVAGFRYGRSRSAGP